MTKLIFLLYVLIPGLIQTTVPLEVKQAEQSGKDWMSASTLNWYKDTKSD